MTAVVVSGALANKAGSGGEAWVRLSWIRGLQRLGLDAWFVEELAATQCTDTDGTRVTPDESVGAAYFQRVVERFGLADRATLLVDGEALVGPPLDDLLALAPSATLVNISGHLAHPRLFPRFRRRVLVDIDPGFTQFWHAAGNPGARVEGHDLHFTIAENIGTPGCTIPTGGVRWYPVRQPVVLDDWPVIERDDLGSFTTIANWRGPFGPIEFDGRTFGVKVHEFRKYLELPRRAPRPFEIALNIDAADERDRRALCEQGWRLVDPEAVSEPETFRRYVQGSGAEFSVAQGVYVDTHSGWFSDRSVRYLASGRPVLVQDTGFAASLPVGEGLLAFRTLEEAAIGANAIATDYSSQRLAARAIAARCFDADVVLGRFCDEAGIATSST
ncbi:MAG: hypothetical protein L0206_18375 [Actinobacteria bacterium]|nr:hypothetical protein [Actinomycetota bacterium]